MDMPALLHAAWCLSAWMSPFLILSIEIVPHPPPGSCHELLKETNGLRLSDAVPRAVSCWVGAAGRRPWCCVLLLLLLLRAVRWLLAAVQSWSRQ
jgi:hypothetical protein